MIVLEIPRSEAEALLECAEVGFEGSDDDDVSIADAQGGIDKLREAVSGD